MGSTLILIGSDYFEEAKNLEYYNFDLEEWTELMELDLKNRFKFQSALLEGKLIIVGGSDIEDFSAIVQSYDFFTDKMVSLAPMKYPRYGHGIAVVDGNLFAIGGYAGDYLNYIERYNPTTNAWTEGKPMPTSRYDLGVAANNGIIYAIGGYGEDFFAVVESYNPKTDTWKTCAPMNEKRDLPGVASIGNFVYAVGGRLFMTYSKTAEKYDPVTDKWTYVESMSVPRDACATINHLDNIIIAGGFLETYEKTNLVESYSGSGTWTTRATLKIPRAYFSLVEVPWIFIKHVQRRKLRN